MMKILFLQLYKRRMKHSSVEESIIGRLTSLWRWCWMTRFMKMDWRWSPHNGKVLKWESNYKAGWTQVENSRQCLSKNVSYPMVGWRDNLQNLEDYWTIKTLVKIARHMKKPHTLLFRKENVELLSCRQVLISNIWYNVTYWK